MDIGGGNMETLDILNKTLSLILNVTLIIGVSFSIYVLNKKKNR